MNGCAVPPRRHVLSVIVEDYFHVAPVRRLVTPRHWPRFESRVERNVEITLDLLDETGAKATFFALGWIAERLPCLFGEIVRRGHEVACRGYYHRSIREMTRAEFRLDARRAKDAVEDATGTAALGYRIAHGSVRPADLWFLDELAELGFAYDSSLRPLGRRFAAEPFRRFVHRHPCRVGDLWEVPLSAWQLGGFAVPISGGNYVRQLPSAFIRRGIAAWEAKSDAPLVFYFHVWELDPDQPRIAGVPLVQRIRQYRNLGLMAERVRRYLHNYRFTSIGSYLDLPSVVVAQRKPEIVADQSTTAGAAPARTAITIVVPCYNEEATLPYLANTLTELSRNFADRYATTFILVDDGSSDGTWRQLEALFAGRAEYQLLRHASNRGIAAAMRTGVAAASSELVAMIDADCSFDPAELASMLPLCELGVAAVTASPYHRDGSVNNVPAWRLVLSKGLSLIYRQIFHNKISSYTSCFRVYRRSTFLNVRLNNNGFQGITEILARLDFNGERIVEYPTVLEGRLLGNSKMKTIRTILDHLVLISQLLILRLGGRKAAIGAIQPPALARDVRGSDRRDQLLERSNKLVLPSVPDRADARTPLELSLPTQAGPV